MRYLLGFFCLATVALSHASAWAGDWPTVAHDIRRSGVTDESLTTPLNLQWVYDSPSKPAPGWSLPVNGYGALKNKSNVSYDDSHRAILVGDTTYFCSSAENRVYAVGSQGEVKWSYFTAAAPRLAPTFWEGRLYFGSDDGRVVCLQADDGQVVWTFSAADSAEQMLGYGRFSSVWPVRTNVMIEGDTAWFAAGLFPSEGVRLYALDPLTGKLRWRREVGRLSGEVEGLAPQGYLLASADSIYVTSRNSPTRFRKSDGEHIPFATPFPNIAKSHEYRFYNGGDYAQIWNDKQIVYGQACLLGYDPDEEWTNRYRRTERGQLKFNWFNARQALLHNKTAYFAMDEYLLSIDQDLLPQVAENEVAAFEELYKRLRVSTRLEAQQEFDAIVAEHGAEDPRALKLKNTTLKYSEASWQQWQEQSPAVLAKIKARCRWMIPLQASESLILAGDVLIAGGENSVYAVSSASGEPLWSDDVGSRVRGLAAANGRLVVSTIDGKVRQYAAQPAADVVHFGGAQPMAASSSHRAETQEKSRVQKLADAVLSLGSFPRGHALVLAGDGELATELAQRTGLTVQLQVTDASQLNAVRTRLAEAGLYGDRITAFTANPQQLPFAPYLFNLVIDRSDRGESAAATPTAELFRVLRPLGGIAVTAAPQSPEETAAFKTLESQGAEVAVQAGMMVVRRGAIPGTTDWTHNYASPSNTYCSEDQKVKGPFGILWYGEPGPRERVDRHSGAPMPLVCQGRMFTIGYDRVMAYDVYNGSQYWERSIQGATRTNLPMGTSNLATDETSLFLVVNDAACWRLDAETGETLRTFEAPSRDDGSRPFWGWLARYDGSLFGSRAAAGRSPSQVDPKHSDELFAYAVDTGELQWRRPIGRVEHDGIAIHQGVMYFVDQVLTPAEKAAARLAAFGKDETTPERVAVDRRGKPIEPDFRKLVALDCHTGEQLWEVPFDGSDLTLDDNAVLDGRSGVSCMVKNGAVVVHGTGSIGHPHREFLAGEFARRSIYVFSADDGKFLWGGRKGYRKRPIIAGDYIYAEPFAWELKTGASKMILNPLSGDPQPFDFHRGYIGCSHLLASGATLFGNKNGIGYCNLDSREGFSSFSSMSLACGLNATPANGVFVAPEGRSGCTCASGGIHTSIALYPRDFGRDWAVGLTGGIGEVNTLPVRHAFINLGAPGYREDEQHRLWLPYPGGNDDGVVNDWIPRYQHDDSMFYYQSPEEVVVTGHELPWLFTSGYHDAKPLTFQLQKKGEPAASYRVTLHFAELEDLEPGERVFHVQVQGKTVLSDFDIRDEAGGPRRAVSKVFPGVKATETLSIALQSANNNGKPPLLSAITIERE
ncbi:outer membrane protein assembly factor BamB family protein [Lignipirellula cremea]|uniref:Outer membrane biogenesis protein BamB n=1 Tax=Lignipirellula cremea TaxID=2528010 RepID=A0A518DWG6_9BACT|nr:PQQ-binding-like beta-propeller repeat protein [Lignipirellula cremea]QDU96173.1 outer membrane biogenesis protein BamB [Lignipirellula cremea]